MLLTTILAITPLVSPLTRGATLSKPQGLSSPSPLNITRGITIEPFEVQCTNSLSWFVPVSIDDCQEAYTKVLADVLHYGSRTYEFADYGIPHTGKYRRRKTPHRYTFRDCTIAIALLSSFPQEYLPAPEPWTPGQRWPDKVLGDYRSFSLDVERVITFCDETVPPAGWVRAGEGGDIGLFVFGTDSAVDKAVPDWMPIVVTANDTLSFDMATS